MRIPKHILQVMSEWLAREPDKRGAALWKEYQRAETEWEALLKKQSYSPGIASNAENAARRLKNWYDAKVKEQTEFVKRKRDDA